MVCLACVMGAPATAGAKVVRYRLYNGLRVALAPDPALEDVSVVLSYGAGRADDPAGEEGLAHLVEHVVWEGAARVSGRADMRPVTRLGGIENAWTYPDRTDYETTVGPEGLPVALYVERRRMTLGPGLLDDVELARDRHILDYERADRGCATNTEARWLDAFFPPGHPYRRPRCGEHLAGITIDDVRAFFDTWYGPANAALAIVGRFDVEAVRPLVDSTFERVSGDEPPARPALTAPWRERGLRIDIGGVANGDYVTMVWRTPARGTRDDRALAVAGFLLADGQGSLLHDLSGRQWAADLDFRLDLERRDSQLVVTIPLVDAALGDFVIDRVDRAIEDLAANVPAQPFERARATAIRSRQRALQSSIERARALVSSEEPIDEDVASTLSAADVQRAVQAYLTGGRRVAMVMRHGPQYPSCGVLLKAREEGAPVRR
jgi:predicted Zn-dependent peptidase